MQGDRLYLPLDGSMGLDDMVGQIIETSLARHDNNVAETSRALDTTREKSATGWKGTISSVPSDTSWLRIAQLAFSGKNTSR